MNAGINASFNGAPPDFARGGPREGPIDLLAAPDPASGRLSPMTVGGEGGA